MRETRVDVFRSMKTEAVRLTHLPTGIITEAETREAAIEILGLRLSEEFPCDLSRFGPLAPISPVPADETVIICKDKSCQHTLSTCYGPFRVEPRQWKYRVC